MALYEISVVVGRNYGENVPALIAAQACNPAPETIWHAAIERLQNAVVSIPKDVTENTVYVGGQSTVYGRGSWLGTPEDNATVSVWVEPEFFDRVYTGVVRAAQSVKEFLYQDAVAVTVKQIDVAWI